MLDKLQDMIKQHRKTILLVLGSLVLLLSVLAAVGFSVRATMLAKAIAKVENKLRKDYDITFKVADAHFRGFFTVGFKHIELLPADRDKLADIEYMAVSVRLWPLLFGNVKIGNLELRKSKVTLVKKDSLSNYDFLFRKKQKDTLIAETASEQNYAGLIDGLIKQVFFKVPRDMELTDFELSYRDDSLHQRIRLPKAVIDGGDFETVLFLNDDDAQWNLSGHVNPDRQQLRVAVASEKEDVELPFLNRKYGLSVSFDKVEFDLKKVKRERKDSLTLAGGWEFNNLKIKHRRLSEETITLPAASGKGQVNIGKVAIEVDPTSMIKVKDFTFQPHIVYIPKPAKVIALSIHTGKFNAQKMFDAIPKGLFETIADIEVQGQIAYDLDFKVDLSDPDNLTFVSKMDDKELKIKKWGKADASLLNKAFTYQAYEDTLLIREIVVGPQNPKFTPLQQVAPVMRKTVMNTEDPHFYQHRGFEEEAFKLSIATNIKEKGFKRGASTISMQLVKNVFLNRNKTMMRKFEEILFVWLMETSGQVSKDRMYEVYLNVIEWGRNVYGIQEAAQYYFSKMPSELTLGESLYLASIVPRPKKGLSSFDYTGHLKPWLQRYFNTYGSIMAKRGQLDDEAVPEAYGFYQVQLREALRPPRPAGLVDTTFLDIDPEQEAIIKELEQEEKDRRGLFDRLFNKEKKEEN